MKILHLGYSDTKGGAAIAMMRLHNSLIKENIDSKVLVAEKLSNDPNVIGPSKSLEVISYEIKKIIARQKKFFMKKKNLYSHSLNIFNSNIVKKINLINPDIVNIHFINNELLSISQIRHIKQPIVWTFLDMWPMCGGEHYSNSNRYKDGYLKSDGNENIFDIDRWLWNKKKKYWKSKINKIVCISDWLKEKALESELFRDNSIEKINCNLDLSIWKPIEQKTARNILNLPTEKKIFLFASAKGTYDGRKGFEFVDKTLSKISNQRKDFEIIILGKANFKNKKNYNFRIIDKFLDGNPIELRLIYSACDLIFAPSKLEAFGQIALEGASCGVPTLAFKKTGIEDIVQHKLSGYLANYADQEDFEKGLNWILESLEKDRNYFFDNCIKIVKNKFDGSIIAKKYIGVYKSLI